VHYLRPYGYVTSVHKGQRLLCLKNCDQATGERATPVGVGGVGEPAAGADAWPTALKAPLGQQAEQDKEEAAASTASGDGEAGSQVRV
jgi:hypothetical protein